MLNNEEKLLQDLMFTKVKGVNERMAVEANFNLEPPIKPVQISPRSSLRSFFPEIGKFQTSYHSYNYH